MEQRNRPVPKLTISQWCVEDRPREKYARKGSTALTDAELLAILLRTGTASESAVDLSKRILHACDNQLNRLEGLTTQQLMEINGIGQAKAVTLQAAFELGRRIRAEKIEQGQHINSAQDVLELMQKRIGHLPHEEFWVIYLNQSARILHIGQIGKGGLSATTVDIRLIFQEALLHQATALILCHNHPSGSVTPSHADELLTRNIKEAGDIFHIEVLDHIILHKNSYYSFNSEGKL